MQMLAQAFIIFLISASMMVRGDIFAVVYFIFIVRMMTVPNDRILAMIARLCIYVSLVILATYMATVLNLTASTSPVPFPEGLDHYPMPLDTAGVDPYNQVGDYAIPVFFKFDSLR